MGTWELHHALPPSGTRAVTAGRHVLVDDARRVASAHSPPDPFEPKALGFPRTSWRSASFAIEGHEESQSLPPSRKRQVDRGVKVQPKLVEQHRVSPMKV